MIHFEDALRRPVSSGTLDHGCANNVKLNTLTDEIISLRLAVEPL